MAISCTKELIETDESDIRLNLYSHFLPHSASFRDETIKILEQFESRNLYNSKIIAIDWSEFSSNIITINGENLKSSPILLESWIDWIVLDTKQKAALILPVADCAAIAAYTKTWEITGLFHAWYKWVAWWENDLGIITNLIEELKKVSNSENLKDFDFYISPMIWKKFELPKDYAEKLFSKLFKEYNLDSEKYFLEDDSDYKKIYLNLREIIKDIFKKHKINLRIRKSWEKESVFDKRDTDSYDSIFPSYRLYSNRKKVQDEIDNIENELKNYINLPFEKIVEIKGKLLTLRKSIKNEKYDNYKIDYRLALVLKNYFNNI